MDIPQAFSLKPLRQHHLLLTTALSGLLAAVALAWLQWGWRRLLPPHC